MNYLTNYYKNLSEQLQEKLNILQTQVNESIVSRKPKPIRMPSPMGTFDHAGDVLTRMDEFGREVIVTEKDDPSVIEKAKEDYENKRNPSRNKSGLLDQVGKKYSNMNNDGGSDQILHVGSSQY
jgi:hypothetical protein